MFATLVGAVAAAPDATPARDKGGPFIALGLLATPLGCGVATHKFRLSKTKAAL